MADPSLAIHKAVFVRLRDGLTVQVYDAVPQAAAFPYVTIDTMVTSNEDFLIERLERRLLFLSVWSQVRGQEEVLGIIRDIDGLMHNARLTLEDGSLISTRIESKSTQRDADDVTFGGQVALRIITQH